MSKFDTDPEALAWARENVQTVIAKYADFEEKAVQKGAQVSAARWRTVVFALRREFVGGEGCVIARFDERKPDFFKGLDDA